MLITKEEFDIKYKKYFDQIFKIAYGYTLNSNDAIDIVQESFIKFYKANKTFTDPEQEKYYLIRITINQSIDFIKKAKHILLFDNGYIDNLPDVLDSDNNYEEINECVSLLKDSYKSVIILYYYENYSIKEISSILKISETAANSRLGRARIKLKKIIEERRNNNGKRWIKRYCQD